MDASIDQCGITHVLTSAKVLDRFKIIPKGQIDSARGHPQAGDAGRQALGRGRRQAGADAGSWELLFPGLHHDQLDATATVIFTSGSTGDPKGVVLSHRNVLSNVHQVEEQVRLKPEEVLLGVLPFFHSFGFTITIWTAICLNKKVVYHFNPLDARTIGKLCERAQGDALDGHAVVHAVVLEELRTAPVQDDHALDRGGRKAQARAGPRHPGRAGHRADGGIRLHRAVAGRGGERTPRGRAARRPQDPRQPAGDRRTAASGHRDQDDRSRNGGRPARRAPKE